MLYIKDLVFKEQLAKKLVDWYIGLYVINIFKLGISIISQTVTYLSHML